ncbi:MAG: hypothetical protein KF852_05260 [Saprospiraceae bacterium]|nr:hypothetical protein [Saprospiraceae bacterium]
MKSLLLKCTFAAVLLLGFAFTAKAQSAVNEQQTANNKPIATYQVGAAKITVWENDRANGSTWKNFVIEKLYKKDGEWKTSNRFDASELLELRSAIDKAIDEQHVKVSTRDEEEDD